MKKTCEGCKAQDFIGREGYACTLEYKFAIKKADSIIFANTKSNIMVPEEECPKPKTWHRYYYQIKLLKGGLI